MSNNKHTVRSESDVVLEQDIEPAARTGRRIVGHCTVFGLALLVGWVARQQLWQVNDIVFAAFRDGQVEVYMQGACSGCPSSTATLKHGIEARLREVIPEVEGVIAL